MKAMRLIMMMGNKGAFIRFEAPNLKPNIVIFSAVDEKLQDVLGHFQKDFEGGVSAENLGTKFGGYGSFLPTYQCSPIWSRSISPPKNHNYSTPKSPNILHLEGSRHPNIFEGMGVCSGCGKANGSCNGNSLLFFGYSGAFRCLVGGFGDIAFVRSDTALLYSMEGPQNQSWSTKSVRDFMYLCPQGGCREINGYPGSCSFGVIFNMARLTLPVLGLGAVIFVISIIGFLGAWKSNSILLWIYLIMLCFILIAILVFTVLAFIVTNNGSGHNVAGLRYKEYQLRDYSPWFLKQILLRE